MNSLLLPFSCGPNTIWFPHDFSGTPQKEEKIAQLCVQATCSVVIGQGFKFGHALQDKMTNFDTKFVNFLFISKYMTDCAAGVSVAAIFISRRRKHNEVLSEK